MHNFVREKDGFNFENIRLHTDVNTHNFHNIPNAQTTRGGISANSIRTFADYFVSEAGSVPWQDKAIIFVMYKINTTL